jgi:putative transposase
VAKKGHTEEQILGPCPGGGSSRVADICREHGISEATFYIWKKKKLKHLVADLSLDRHILQEIVQKKL